MTDSLRPVVAWFARQMEAKLAANDGVKADWSDDAHALTKSDYLAALRAEVDELQDELFAGRHDPSAITRECADVANYALIIADLCDGRIGRTEA